MSQYVRRYALLDPNRFGSITHDPVELACGDGQEGIAPGKQPQPWPRHPPVVLQDRQQLTLEADANSRALDLLGQAIDRDPDHAFAVALSAWCMGQRVAPPFLFTNALAQDRRRLWLEATTVARRALTLRAGASELAILGNAFAITGNLGTAEVVTQKALSISGSSVWACPTLNEYAGKPSGPPAA